MCLSKYPGGVVCWGGGGVIWRTQRPDPPARAQSPTHPNPKKLFSGEKRNFERRTKTERPLLGTQVYFLHSDPPPP